MTDPMIKPIIKNFTPEWKRDGSVWEAYRRSCPTDSAARRLIETVRSAESNGALVVQGRATSKLEAPQTRRVKSKTVLPSTREMTFSHALDADFNVCDYPSLHTLHSAFYSDQRSIEYLYPVFSPSKPAGFADILIPSHHYWSPLSEFTYEAEFRRGLTKSPTDIDWALKKNTSYWRGKVTRGADTPPGHGSSFQKQRLVKMANQETMATNRVLVGFEPKTASITALSVPIAIANKATSDVAMACDPSLGECSYLRSLGYRVEPPAPMSEAWKHKFVLDIDEIGFSPRFPALMESKSAVVKSSIQREFWRGWAQPWCASLFLSFAQFSQTTDLLDLQETLHPALVVLFRAAQHPDLFRRLPYLARRQAGQPLRHCSDRPHTPFASPRAPRQRRWDAVRHGQGAEGDRRSWCGVEAAAFAEGGHGSAFLARCAFLISSADTALFAGLRIPSVLGVRASRHGERGFG